MERIYICSKLRATHTRTQQEHEEDARKYAKFVINENKAPFVPHLLYTQFLDDTDEKQRRMAMNAGLAYLNSSDALYAFVDETLQVSEGMRSEIQYAMDHNIPIKAFIVDTEGNGMDPMEHVVNLWDQGVF